MSSVFQKIPTRELAQPPEQPRRFRIKVDITSRDRTYGRAGDVVAYISETSGHEAPIIIYEDATGERFSTSALNLVEVPRGTALKKQPGKK